MAIVPVAELIRERTREELLDDLILLAESMGLAASNWRRMGIARWLLLATAEMGSRSSVLVSAATAAGYNDTAFLEALTRFSRSHYDNERLAAIAAQGTVKLTNQSGDGPYTIAAGEKVFTDDDNGFTYRNITGGTLPASGGATLELTVEAETAGADRNVSNNKIHTMNPTIAGVTVDNPAIVGTNSWITRNGVNAEPDATLQRRNPLKFTTLGGASPGGAFEFWALSALTPDGDPVGITRVFVDATNPMGPNTLIVYVADSDGTASPAQVVDVQAYIDARKPVTARPIVMAATPVTVSIAGTFHVTLGLGLERQTDVNEALAAYINELPIGGTNLGSGGRVLFSELIATAMEVDDVKNVTFTSPTADVALSQNSVAIFDGQLVAVEVA